MCWSLFLIKLQSWRSVTVLKTDSSTSVFLWIPQNFQECLFWRTCERLPLWLEKGLVCTAVRSSRPEVFLGKGALKICNKLTGEHPCQCVISIMLQSNFVEIPLRHGCSPVSLLHIFRIPFPKNTSGWVLLYCSDLL